MKRILFMTCCLVAIWPGAALGQQAGDEGLFRLKPLVRLGDLRWRVNQFIQALAFAPDGKTLAIGGGNSIDIWDVATGQRIHERKKNAWSLAWTPDGGLIAAGQEHSVRVWDAAGKERELPWHKRVVTKISVSADGKTLASLDALGDVAVGDVATGKVQGRFKCPDLWSEMALSPNAKLLVTNGGLREPIQIWDVATGERLRVCDDGRTYVKHLKFVFTADSQRVIAADNGDLCIWDVATGKLLREMKKAFHNFPSNVIVSPDGKYCAHDSSDTINVWNLADGKLHRTLEAPGQSLYGLAFSSDSKTLAAGHRYMIINLWDIETGRSLTAGDGHTGAIDAVAWLTPDRVLTTGRDRSFRTWDAITGRLEKVVAAPAGLYQLRALTPDGATMLGNNVQGGLGVFDLATGVEKAAVPRAGDWYAPFVLSPRGTLAALNATRPSGVRLVPTTPAGTGRVISGPDRRIFSFAISPDDKLIAIGYEQKYDGEFPRQAMIMGPVKIPPRRKDPTIFLHDVATGRETRRFGESLGNVTSLAFSPNGRQLVAGDDQPPSRPGPGHRQALQQPADRAERFRRAGVLSGWPAAVVAGDGTLGDGDLDLPRTLGGP